MKYVIFIAVIEIDICHLHNIGGMKEEHVLLLLRTHFAGFYYLLTIIHVINNKMYIMQYYEKIISLIIKGVTSYMHDDAYYICFSLEHRTHVDVNKNVFLS